ncbi:MAG: winged helix-turn-helix transcriptional regulator [Methanomicrobiales archaeon]|nr:winged helix-turn-helix transcriptional regulator [Methanomicrobiales archaeon]
MAVDMTGVREETIEAVSRNLISLFPLFHGKIHSRERGITGMQLAGHRVLGVLLRYGPLPISDVGKRLYISKPYMTRLVDNLIAEDLVERLPDASDRRVINIRITGKGRGRIQEIGTMLRDDIQGLFSELSDDDIQVLDESLKNLNRVLGKLRDS